MKLNYSSANELFELTFVGFDECACCRVLGNEVQPGILACCLILLRLESTRLGGKFAQESRLCNGVGVKLEALGCERGAEGITGFWADVLNKGAGRAVAKAVVKFLRDEWGDGME